MYRSLNDVLRSRFGCKVYKLSLSTGCSCPNRDGTLDTRGCIFCNGSGDFTASSSLPVVEQIEQAKYLVAKKAKDAKYIAYFQDYTNTHAPAEKLEPLFLEAIQQPDVVALSIATRPDCLGPEILAMLARLRTIKPVWVELGLQTMHEKTAQYIRRGYPLSVYEEAVHNLHAAGCELITHMILGLPGETPEMMAESARYIGSSGADGIKFHLLHVLHGTDLEREYTAGAFHTLELEEYIDILEDCLRVLPPETVIHRLTGDGAKRSLIAPLWSADKKHVLNEIHRRFAADHLVQGERYSVDTTHEMCYSWSR